MQLRVRRTMTHSGRAPRALAGGVAAVALACSVALVGCSKDDTTTVEPPTTEASSASSSTVVTSKEGVDAIIATWVQLGFSEDQARCLVEQMNTLSSQVQGTDTDSMTPNDQSLIEQMMKDCKIDDESLKAQLGG